MACRSGRALAGTASVADSNSCCSLGSEAIEPSEARPASGRSGSEELPFTFSKISANLCRNSASIQEFRSFTQCQDDISANGKQAARSAASYPFEGVCVCVLQSDSRPKLRIK